MIARALGRALEAGRAVATAYGQILFCESPVSGLCLFIGLALLAPGVAWASAAGGAVATLVARARRYPLDAWRSGLYGYTGVLVGFFWTLLFEPTLGGWILLVVAAALSAPLARLAHRLLTPRNIPTLALPALCLLWLAGALLDRAPSSPAAAGTASLLGWGLILAGIAVHSRLLAAAALLGAAVGAGISGVLLGHLEPAVLSNSALAAAALGGVFLPWSAAALGIAAVGAAAAGALWAGTHAALGAWGSPPLVAPFNLVIVLILAALRVPAIRRRVPGRPAPLPLASVGRPETSRAAWLAHRRLAALVGAAGRVCVLTGAGVSTAAGLPDYRGPFGLWAGKSRVTLDDFLGSQAAREAYWREEAEFFRRVRRASPTAVHEALVALHRQGRLTAVVTQNVDGLHQAAGLPPEKVIELHGSVHEARCVDCGHAVARERLSGRMAAGKGTLYCDRCQGLLKGGSVLFGEPVEPAQLEAALRALLASDVLLVLGTSLAVAPASDLVRWARDAGIRVAIVNATATPYDGEAALTVTADVGAVMLDLVQDPPDGGGVRPAVLELTARGERRNDQTGRPMNPIS